MSAHEMPHQELQSIAPHNGNGHNRSSSSGSNGNGSATRTPENDPWTQTALQECVAGNWTPNHRVMLFATEDHAPILEQFRMLRSRLYDLRERTPLKTVLVTSSVPKEGKSFAAANLAQVMASQPSCRVLLVDADLRSSTLHHTLGTISTPGLSEYLLGEKDELAILQRGNIENLYFVPSGRRVSGQAELVSSGRLKAFLDRVNPLFDWIIVDSPAALPVSDAGLISNLCDGVLLVVRSHSTPFDIVRKTRERFRDERLLGVVLNGTPADSHVESHYYYGAMEVAPEPGTETGSNNNHHGKGRFLKFRTRPRGNPLSIIDRHK